MHSSQDLPFQPVLDKQKIAYNPSLTWGQVHPKSASSPGITVKQTQSIRSKAIAHFFDWAHIWWKPRNMFHLHLGEIKLDGVGPFDNRASTN